MAEKYDLDGARKAGVPEAEILSYLTSQVPEYDLAGARKAGVSDDEIMRYLASSLPAPAGKPEKSFTGFLGNAWESGKKQLKAVGELAYKANPVTGFSPVSLEGKLQKPPIMDLLREIGVFPVGAVQKLTGMEGESAKALDAIGADYKQAYGSKDQFLETLYTDPMRAISDLSMLAGGSTAGLKAAGAAAKAGGATRTASAVAKAAKAAEVVDDILNLPAKGAALPVKAVGKLSQPGPMREGIARRFYDSAFGGSMPITDDIASRNRALDFGIDNSVMPTDYEKSGRLRTDAAKVVQARVDELEQTVPQSQYADPRRVAQTVEELKAGPYGEQTFGKKARSYIDQKVDELLAEFDITPAPPPPSKLLGPNGQPLPAPPSPPKQYRTVGPAEAQRKKQSDYAVVGENAYEGRQGLPVEVRKASARGWKERLEEWAPELKALNEVDAASIDLDQAIRHRTVLLDRKNLIPLGSEVGAVGGAMVGGPAGAASGFGLMRVLEAPNVKAKLAFAIKKAQIQTATAEQLIRGAQTGVGPGSKAAVAARIEEIMRQLEAGQAQPVPAH